MSRPQPETEHVEERPALELFRAALDASPHGLMLQSGDAVLYRNSAWAALEGAAGDANEERHVQRSHYEFDYCGRLIEVSIAQDVTERKRMEATLREAQRLEALGRWVGGVVHDFNNLLTAVMLYSDLLAPHLAVGSIPEAYNEEVRQAVRRGTDLISQLLSFARQQQAEPEVFSLNSLLRSLREVLGRMIGEDVEIVYELAEAACNVRVTPAQIEQVVFNLALNSRDAMPGVGTIRIRTEEVLHQEEHGPAQVALIVTDTGCGMDQPTLARIFEPFYSTKPHGKGTGLGLSTVQSIVTRCGGTVSVESSPGRGTEVRILLPRAEVPSKLQASSALVADVPRGSETVLVVEDDTAVRESIREALTQCGYIVQVAADGPGALAAVAGMERPPDLLITDLVLPGISGRELARRLHTIVATVPTLFISGYEQSSTAQDADNLVFAKPFSRESLARKVRQLLDCEKPGSVRHGE